ncbi:type I DNA topoisomerase [candidate division TA06 bacterium]|uniref:DNA topoisomerase 1 n=1 Tax=candidate division TA06 bacterium TaxID=2250710 RepID=A0A523XX88_UNCT6|nr:MAG: type I DNA topoisomerase [candidate division TA06 bacterium]
MASSLVVVESPTKAKTISRILGKGFVVLSSMGHVKDLPKARLGVDVQNGFRPEYITIRGKGSFLRKLKDAAKTADKVFIATDPDREGEAIAFHIAKELKNKHEVYRVLFFEITASAVKAAMASPGAIDAKKVDAQQARRILDRLVGYEVSPILWKTIRRGLSAGRVQTVALRLVCERESEIESFVPKEWWDITAQLLKGEGEPFSARLTKISEEKPQIESEEMAGKIIRDLKGLDFVVKSFQRGEKKQRPQPPYSTSTLQQDCSRRLGFSPRKTMVVAQQLFEGIELGKEGSVGLITYMRTDSTRSAPRAIEEVRSLIGKEFGDRFVPEKLFIYKSRKRAQEAHEAIRPTSSKRTPDSIKKNLDKNQFRLYELVWKRFVASQMAEALYRTASSDIDAGQYTFRATASKMIFPGFTKVYEIKNGNGRESGAMNQELPHLSQGDRLELVSLDKKQHFTQPPPRFTEATLVRELEHKGIGRPSTYAPTISTILDRGYVEVSGRKLIPTDLGITVNKILVPSFPEVFAVGFTANMEELLDKVESGESGWKDVLGQFYGPFSEQLRKVESESKRLKETIEEETGEACPECGKPLVIRWGRYGKFLACKGYPECKYTKPVEEEDVLEEPCPECRGKLIYKTGRYGRFVACSNYPQCQFTRPVSVGVKCPKQGCSGEVVERTSRKKKVFYSCSRYPDCDFATWYKPVPIECPQCGASMMVEKNKKDGRVLQCLACKHKLKGES